MTAGEPTTAEPVGRSAVLVSTDDGVRVITLNRPERLNAFNDALMGDLAEAVADAAADSGVGCVVVTGAGKAFCAGGDVKGAPREVVVSPQDGGRIEQGAERLRRFYRSARLLHEMGKPTIAMINGPVAGAGIGVAGACDLRFAAASAVFVSAFDRIGASGDFGASWFWTKILGSGAAREVFLLGEKYSAEEALRKGIYTRVFPDEALVSATMEVARRLAAGPRMGWRYMKANLNLAEDGDFETALDAEALNMCLSTAAMAQIARARKSEPQ